MSFDAGSITGSLELDTGGFAHGMLLAEGLMQTFPAAVSEFLANPLLGLIEIAKEAGHALFEMVHGVTSSEAELHHMAASLGVSVEWLDAMAKSAQKAGSNLMETVQGIQFLNRHAYDAVTAGGLAAHTFEVLGVSVKDSADHFKSTQQLTEEVITAFSKLDASSEKTAIAMNLFGRGGGRMVSFFNEGMAPIRAYRQELAGLGALATKESAESAHAFEELLTTVDHAWEGIKKQIAEPVRDALMPYLEGLLEWVKTHPAEIRAEVVAVVQIILGTLKLVIASIAFLLNHLDLIKAALGAGGIVLAIRLAVGAIGTLISTYTALAGAIAAATVAQNTFNASRLTGAAGIGAGVGGLAGGGGIGSIIGGGLGGGIGFLLGNLLLPGIGGLIGQLLLGALGGFIGGKFDTPSNTFNFNINGGGREQTLDEVHERLDEVLRRQDQEAASRAGKRALGAL